MDEMIVKPKYSRQIGTQRKKKSTNENEMMSTIFAVKMLAVVVFLSVFALCKAADTTATNYFISKVKIITAQNFDTNKYLLSTAATLGIKLPDKNSTAQGNVSGKNAALDINSDESVQTLSQSGSNMRQSTDESIPGKDNINENNEGININQNSSNQKSINQIGPLQKDTDTNSTVNDTADPASEAHAVNGQNTLSDIVPETLSSSISDNLQALTQVPILEEAEIKTLADKYSFVIPIKGQIDSPFGIRTDPLSGKTSFHSGIDIKANMGTSIKAALDGEVTEVGSSPEYDNYVKIKHSDGLYTVYAHCSILVPKEGQKVKQGDVIAKVGDTEGLSGAYLHFEVWKGDKAADPEKILNLLNK